MEVRKSVDRSQWGSLLLPLREKFDLKGVRGPSMGQYREFAVVWVTFYRGIYFLPAARKNFLSLNNVSTSAYYQARMRLGDDKAATAQMKLDFIQLVRDEINASAVEVDLEYCRRFPEDSER